MQNERPQLPLRIDRNDIKWRVLHTSRELLTFATLSFGPRGRASLLQKSANCADALVLTSTSDRFFQHLDVGDCPIANVYFQMLRSQLRSHSDAGLFLVILSASLQIEIQDGALAHLPRQVVLRGLELAREWSLAYLDDDACPVRLPIDWSQRASIRAIIRGIVSTKSAAALREQVAQDALISLVLDTFLALYECLEQNPREAAPVRFVHDPGHASVAKLQLWRDSVLLDFAWPHGCASTPRTSVTLALFNITIDPLRHSTAADTSTEHTGSQTLFRLEALRRIGDALEQLGVSAVMSQKIIPRFLQTYLIAKGMFVLDRLSLNHIHAVHQLSGAVVLGDWDLTNVDASILGFLSLITPHEISGKQYIRLHHTREQHASAQLPSHCTPRLRPVATIVLSAPHKYAFEELSYAIETALKRLAALTEAPDAVAGAGCTELHLASFVRERAKLLQCLPSASAHDRRAVRQLRQVVEVFAACLLRVVAALGGESSTFLTSDDEESLLAKLRKANRSTLQREPHPDASESVTLFGWSPLECSTVAVAAYARCSSSDAGDERQVLHAHVLDAFSAKRDALVLALECVSTLARIASVVRVS